MFNSSGPGRRGLFWPEESDSPKALDVDSAGGADGAWAAIEDDDDEGWQNACDDDVGTEILETKEPLQLDWAGVLTSALAWFFSGSTVFLLGLFSRWNGANSLVFFFS